MPQFRERMGEAAFGDPQHFVGQGSDILYGYLQPKVEAVTKRLSDYVSSNLASVINKVDSNSLLQYAMQFPAYETGDKAHDAVVKQHKEFIETAKLAKAGNDVKVQYISQKLEEIFKDKDFIPGFMYAALSPNYIPMIFESIVRSKQMAFLSNFATKKNEVDKKKVAGYLEANMAKAKEEEKTQAYVTLAHQAVAEEEARKEEKEEKKKANKED